MEGLFDNLEGRSDSQNFEPLTSTLRFSPCEVYKFSVGHFLTGYIFYVLILNIGNQKFHFLAGCIFYVLILNIEHKKFHFLTKICEIRNKR